MKKDIHPKYKELKIVIPNGDEFTTSSTYSGESVLLDVDFREHPAWKGGVASVNTKSSQVTEFNKKFGGIFSAPTSK
ncbi:MAG: 50S ribosomal protein L31 [Rickettsiales bacterium]|jgi:large subunit ribosomal protein L31|nr:50S ribosomal protein L31 [Rickettsiales bacterium]